MNIGVWLSYDGTRYDGWQKQGNTDRTIQDELEVVLKKLEGGPAEVHDSDRIDAGVHAESQVVNFHLVKRMEPGKILDCMNRYLSKNTAATRAYVAPERFHNRLNTVKKIYHYQIETVPKKNVFEHYYYYGSGQKLDAEGMKRTTVILTETRDYKSFCGNERVKKPTVRTIGSIRFEQTGSRTHISFTGNSSLRQMVRILPDTLIEVGVGKQKPEEMARVLEARKRSVTGFTAPPEGLFLENVECGDLT